VYHLYSEKMRKKFLRYAAETLYGATRYPCGWLKPRVVRGYFPKSREGQLQQLFFRYLLEQNFRRTPWQLVLPGQTAGLIRRCEKSQRPKKQYHVRFFREGYIHCEIEPHRFTRSHWSGERACGLPFLNTLLEEQIEGLSHLKSEIRSLFAPELVMKKSLQLQRRRK
jgi:hypothetical protein